MQNKLGFIFILSSFVYGVLGEWEAYRCEDAAGVDAQATCGEIVGGLLKATTPAPML